MTSGPGENQPGGPYGPPQGWNAPPPPPPQYPGYAPAPAAGYGRPPGVPQTMERPLTVRAGLGAFLGSMALSAVAQVVTMLNWRRIIDWTFANAGIDPGSDLDAARQGAEIGARICIVVGFLFIAVYGLFAASVRDHVLSRPTVMTWLRRSFAAGFAAIGAKLAFAER